MRLRSCALSALVVPVSIAALSSACGAGPTEGPKEPDLPPLGSLKAAPVTSAPEGRPLAENTPSRPKRPKPPADDEPRDIEDLAELGETGPDPLGGTYTLAQATADIGGTGALIATIATSKGELRCKLYEDKAPVTVANFVGLARGERAWKRRGRWVNRPAYDGTTFHRVIKGFMIQGGDPLGTGRGEPGYVIPDEIWPGSRHDRPGLLCMANRGPNTNGMQFFITDAAAPHLGGSYTIFGECSPVNVVHAIARVSVEEERPLDAVRIERVTVARAQPGPAPAPAAPPRPAASSSGSPAPATSGSATTPPASGGAPAGSSSARPAMSPTPPFK